ncbi:MAG: RNB domain-containing ribonuclease [Proteobacteria bacterium]|nr:RNB domain-containing ribonuclease [Pseudomonadota bacterium]
MSIGNTIDLGEIARRILQANGFEPEMPDLDASVPDRDPIDGVVDLRDLPWSSIDNADSKDLDQIEYAEELPAGAIRLLVGIADVDALAPKGSPIDRHAAVNTATLYTPAHIFPMLPELLSIDRTSLLEDRQRLAMITEMVVRADGSLDDAATKIYPARVRNHAKLVYERVGAWLEGDPDDQPPTGTIATQVTLQDAAAGRLRRRRYEHGALELDTIEARAVAKGGHIVDMQVVRKNRARELVEDLMIAANGATARFLEQRGFSSIRRVVAKPRRWDRIVLLAHDLGTALPAEPDGVALAGFLTARRHADPARFGELSLAIVKLLGPGEYVLQRATEPDIGHFGLAVQDYTHSTAPNRRYPDLITQRLLKACAQNLVQPYTDDELIAIAAHCTERENAARKVERTLRKVAAADLLSSRIGDEFDGIITGANERGVFVRLFHPAAEGRIVRGEAGLDVGQHVRVRLIDVDIPRGFIDFVALRYDGR